MRKILAALLLAAMSVGARAQNYPSPHYRSLQVDSAPTFGALNGLVVGNGASPATSLSPGSGVASALGSPVNSPNGLPILDSDGRLFRSQIPAPTASGLGGVSSFTGAPFQVPWQINTDGTTTKTYVGTDIDMSAQPILAKDDDSTDNKAVIDAAVTAYGSSGRCLYFPRRTAGVYRTSAPATLGSMCIRFDATSKLANADGSTYSGPFLAGLPSVWPNILSPADWGGTRRITAPQGDYVALGPYDGNAHARAIAVDGINEYPYGVVTQQRDFMLIGQNAATTVSPAQLQLFANVYNFDNGPGVNFSCTATNGSAVLTACSPSPTGTQAKGTGNVYNPAKITVTSGTAVPANTYVQAWDASSITMKNDTASANYSGTTGPVTVNVVSGRSEMNTFSTRITPVGESGSGGPAGGTNWYSDFMMASNRSTSSDDQEGGLFGAQFMIAKQAPGNRVDRLHNGSAGVSVTMVPNLGNTTYPVNAGLSIQGWSGPYAATWNKGGQNASATQAALTGLRIGGKVENIYVDGSANARSSFGVGASIEDYDTAGLVIKNKGKGATSSTYAISTESGAGPIQASDGVLLGGYNGVRSINDTTNLFVTGSKTGDSAGINIYGGSHATYPNQVWFSAGGAVGASPTVLKLGDGYGLHLLSGAAKIADTTVATSTAGNGALNLAGDISSSASAYFGKTLFVAKGGSQAPHAAGQGVSVYVDSSNRTLIESGLSGTGWAPIVLAATTVTLNANGAGVLQTTTDKTVKMLASFTVATLPTCNSGAAGSIAYVTDATSPTYLGALTGGGSSKILALCNGSAWAAH